MINIKRYDLALVITMIFTSFFLLPMAFAKNGNKATNQVLKGNAAEEKRVPDFKELEGGYAPKPELILSGYEIAVFETRLNQERSKVLEVFFTIKKGDKNTGISFYPCTFFKVGDGKIEIRTGPTPVGEIEFAGNFLPVNGGDYWQVGCDTPVLKGNLVVRKNGKVVYSNKAQEFTYVVGE